MTQSQPQNVVHNPHEDAASDVPTRVHVAVVDSGLDTEHKSMRGLRILNAVSIGDKVNGQDVADEWGHGTACTYIISRVIEPSLRGGGCGFSIVKVFAEGLAIDEDRLIRALEWCIDEGVDVVNLSLGLASQQPSKELAAVCRRAFDNGIVIVAPDDNEGESACFPAYFPHVFGVTGGIVRSRSEYGVTGNASVEFIGKGTKQRVAWSDGRYVFESGTSFATAQLTGIVCNAVAKYPDLSPEEIREHLLAAGRTDVKPIGRSFARGGSGYSISAADTTEVIDRYFKRDKRLGWMERVGVYPYSNKEMRAFDTFSDLCPFEVAEILDYPKSVVASRLARVGKKELTRSWQPEKASTIDTLAIGYPYETPFETNHFFFQKIVDFLLDRELNAFCLSEEIRDEIARAKLERGVTGGEVYAPAITDDDAEVISSLGAMGMTTKPVLAVVGTNTRQGKFTCQLRIKQALSREGYKVGWLSTEPQGELFGADFAFPYGFDGSVHMDLRRWPHVLSSAVRGIEIGADPDLILTGHQSGLLPHTRANFLKAGLNHLTFLSGVQPDAVACVVSREDGIEGVIDVITVVKHLLRVPTVFLALSPYHRHVATLTNGRPYLRVEELAEEDWQAWAHTLTKETGLPVVDALGAGSTARQIVGLVESAFAAKSQ